jgi:hypothetical protein
MGGSEGSEQGDFSNAANGEYDQNYRDFANELIDLGMEETIIRPDAEFNLDWSHNKPQNPENYASAFARLVREMNDVAKERIGESKFEFLFSPSRNNIGIADQVKPMERPEWPSDAEPPIMAPSFYDAHPPYPDDTSQVTEDMVRENIQDEKDKLMMWKDMADRRGYKGMGAPEWGVATAGYPASPGGDNPLFIEEMMKFFDEQGFIFQTYWNSSSSQGGSHVVLPVSESPLPNSAEKFRSMLQQRL